MRVENGQGMQQHIAIGELPHLGQHLRGMAHETIDAQSEGWARDYAGAFLDAVNWREIAEHMIEDYRPEAELCRNGVALADCDCC